MPTRPYTATQYFMIAFAVCSVFVFFYGKIVVTDSVWSMINDIEQDFTFINL